MPIFYLEYFLKFYTHDRINSETIVPFNLIICGEETIDSNISDDMITLFTGISPVTYILEDLFTFVPASYQNPSDCPIEEFKFC